ncbi:MAG: hypothetical protein E6G41_02230 [Actinobacteria bacterium]|nr:MAG: hypothetical protein E6G41_02230 [Actinomycetota bacterium]
MKARVATWRGGDPATIQANLDEIRARESSGPPEGVPSTALTVLQSEDEVIFIALFETEEDLRQGDATLNEMNPPGGGMGERTVAFYDVPIKFETQRA